MGRDWPKRQGNIKAIILTERSEAGEYEVFEQDKTYGPGFEGSEFRRGSSMDAQPSYVKGHYFVFRSHVDGNGVSTDRIVGIAHSKEELLEEIYNCAKSYCKKRAKLIRGKFVDLTSRAKSSKLEARATSS